MYWTNLTSKVAGTLMQKTLHGFKGHGQGYSKIHPRERLITFTSKNCNTADNKKVEK